MVRTSSGVSVQDWKFMAVMLPPVWLVVAAIAGRAWEGR
jgi:hypothetical protein